MGVVAVGAGDIGDFSPYPVGDPRNENNPEGIVANTRREEEEKERETVLDSLASHISRQWEINRRDKQYVEQQMLRAQEAVNNQYDPTTLAAIESIGGSKIYIPLTSMQVNAGVSWLLSVLNPPGDKAFSFKRTPVPDLPEEVRIAITSQVARTISQGAPKDEQGQTLGPDGGPVTQETVDKVVKDESEDALEAINKEADRRAEKMELMVADQLGTSGWFKTLEDFVHELCVFPTAFIKTTYEYKTKMAVIKSDSGDLTMEADKVLVEKDERVSPFDIYPSPDQTDMTDGSMIERIRLTNDSIFQCIGIPGYSEDNILKVLEDNPNGTTEFQSTVDSQRRKQENHGTSFSGDDGSYYGLRFTGPVTMKVLVEWGYPIKDLKEYGLLTEDLDENDMPALRDMMRPIQIDAILVGGCVIKAIPNLDPEGKRPYYMASYRKVPGSFWGKSVAMLAEQHQRLVNATARALSNNMGISSGPQIWLNVDRLPNGEAINTIVPLKIWQGTNDPQNTGSKPIEFFQPQSNAQELLGVYQSFFDSVGDVTGIPKAAYLTDPSKQSPAAQTAAGMAMLLETASKQIKQAVRNIDTGVIEARLHQQYKVNMMDPEIPNDCKGDFNIIAIGAQSIVAKAVQNQRSIELLQTTANPTDAKILGPEGRGKLIKNILREYDMLDIVPSEKVLAQLAEQEKMQQQGPTPEQTKLKIEELRASVRLEDQKLENHNAAEERKTRLAIAKLDYDSKVRKIEADIATSASTNQTKINQTVLKEQSSNARLDAEMVLKDQMGSGV